MTEGPVSACLFKMTMPLFWGILAVLAYRLAEAWFVGALGSKALAAISFAFPVTMVVLSLSIGLGAGTSSVIARALGAKEEGVPRLVADSLILTLVLAAVCAVAGVLGARPLAWLLGAGPDLVPDIAAYLRVWFPTAILILLPQVGLSAARAAGDSAFQGFAMIASTLLNLAILPVTVFGAFGLPGFGLAGAPLATGLAWLPLLGATLWRLRQLHILSFEQLRLDEFLVSSRRILRVGLPAAATNTVIPVASGIITALLAPYGHEVVAGFGLGSRVEAVAMVPFFALSAVMNPFAGQNLGACRVGRVREAMRKLAVFCLVLGAAEALVLYAGRDWISSRFTSSTAVIAASVMYLAFVPLSYGPGGMIAIANAAFNGLDRPFAAVLVSVARTLLVNVPVAWLGARLFGVAGVFFGICAANVLVGVASWVWVMAVTDPSREEKPCVAS
jgi:putative MATE family efflux protein